MMFFNIQELFDSTILAAILGAFIGAILTFLANFLFNLKKEANYRKAFMFTHKLTLLELPTYLKGATYLEDPHGQWTISRKLKEAEPRVIKELVQFRRNIENIFSHNNSMYLRSKDLEILNRLYVQSGFLTSILRIDGIEYLEEAEERKDVLKEISTELFIEVRKLDGPNENKAYEEGLKIEI